MKKTVALIALCFMLVLAACSSGGGGGSGNSGGSGSSGSNNDISGKITVSSVRTDIVDTVMNDQWSKKIKEKYPNLDVTFEAYANYDQDIRLRIASGDYPDVLMMPGFPATDWAQYFLPLNDLGYNGKIYFEDNYSHEGNLYAITAVVVINALVYSKTAFETAGIKELPKTWNELLAVAEKLKAAGIVPMLTDFKDQWTIQYYFTEAKAFEGNKSWYDDFMLKTDKPFTKDSAMGKGALALKELAEKGYTESDLFSTNWDQSKIDLGTGKAGMFFIGNWFIQQAADLAGTSVDTLGMMPFPAPESWGASNVISMGPDWPYAINKNTKNPEAAKAVLKWLIEESNYEVVAGAASPLKDKQSELSSIAELMAMNPTVFQELPASPKWAEVYNKAEINWGAILQEAVTEPDMDAVFAKWNKKWADARAALGVQ